MIYQLHAFRPGAHAAISKKRERDVISLLYVYCWPLPTYCPLSVKEARKTKKNTDSNANGQTQKMGSAGSWVHSSFGSLTWQAVRQQGFAFKEPLAFKKPHSNTYIISGIRKQWSRNVFFVAFYDPPPCVPTFQVLAARNNQRSSLIKYCDMGNKCQNCPPDMRCAPLFAKECDIIPSLLSRQEFTETLLLGNQFCTHVLRHMSLSSLYTVYYAPPHA